MHACRLICTLLLVVCAGCLTPRRADKTGEWLTPLPQAGPTGPDGVTLEYVVIERAMGYPGVNQHIWPRIDEQVIPAEQRLLLADNGFRIGRVVGLPTAELETLLAQPKSGVGHRQRRMLRDQAMPLMLNGPVALGKFHVKTALDAAETTPSFEQAQYVLSITPRAARSGIVLECVPEVHFRDKNWTPPGGIAAGMFAKPIERYSKLGWEVTLEPRDLFVIGMLPEKDNTLASEMLTGKRGEAKTQRLLVIRATDTGKLAAEPMAGVNGIIPLASQAATGVPR